MRGLSAAVTVVGANVLALLLSRRAESTEVTRLSFSGQ